MSLYIGLVMAVVFLLICLNRIIYLQKEVRKLNKISSYLLNEIKEIKKDNNG